MPREALRIALALVASLAGWILVLPVLAVGLLFRGFNGVVQGVASWREPETVPWPAFLQFDPVLGWKPRERMDVHYVLNRDDIHHLMTDENGWPGTNSIAESEVVVFGDSFAFGTGMDTEKGFMSLTAGFRTKAIGAPGYSMVQPVQLMRHLASELSGKLVVWLVYLENDLHDNLIPSVHAHRSPFVKRRTSRAGAGWEIVTDHISPEPWLHQKPSQPNMDILGHLCAPGPLSDRVYSAAGFLIGEGAAAVSGAGARLVVLSVPNLHQLSPAGVEFLRSRTANPEGLDPEYPDRRLEEACRERDVEFFSGMKVFRAEDYKPYEKFHWTESGHRKAAGILEGLASAPQRRTGRQRSRSPVVPTDPGPTPGGRPHQQGAVRS